ncbi:MAG: hypothetical protein GX752_02660 [Clostridium sp.]|nr:hypothetical protein [Clostridium sp.]
MNKKTFIKTFEDEDEFLMARLFEDLMRAKSLPFNKAVENFYTPNIWEVVSKMKAFQDLSIIGEDYFERKIFSNSKDYNPLGILKIENMDFNKELTHKDYLGKVMSLGIERDKLGDIFIKENIAYGIIFKDMYEFFNNNISYVGKSYVDVSFIEYEKGVALIKPNLKNMEMIVSSLRIDSVVSEISRKSRNKAQMDIKSGIVFINYNEEKNRAKEIEEDDIITIRGSGKFKIGNMDRKTKKGNYIVNYYKFD